MKAMYVPSVTVFFSVTWMFSPRGIYGESYVSLLCLESPARIWGSSSFRVEGQTYQSTNAGTDVEDTPEPSPVPAFALLNGIRHDDSTLRRPQQTGADTEKSTCKDIEAGHICMHRDQQTNRVEAVTDTTKGQRKTHANAIDDGSRKETHDGKGTVEGNVLRKRLA